MNPAGSGFDSPRTATRFIASPVCAPPVQGIVTLTPYRQFQAESLPLRFALRKPLGVLRVRFLLFRESSYLSMGYGKRWNRPLACCIGWDSKADSFQLEIELNGN